MSLFNELKRRNVFRVGAAYAVVAWLVIQVVETIFPLFGFDETPARIVVIVLAIGFIPTIVFSWAFELTPEGLKKEKDIERGQSIAPQTGRKLDRMIMVTLALALGYFAFDKFVLEPQREAALMKENVAAVEQALQKGRSEALVESFGDKSIAVLAFDDMSPEGDQEYLSDGIAEELLNLLTGVPGLRVISRSSSFYYKDKDIKLNQIAEELNVNYILEGSVRKSGNRVRITAQLIEARSDTHLWSQAYERTLEDIFATQNEIAEHVVEELKITLMGEQPHHDTVDPDAYALYLQANYFFNQVTSEGRSRAVVKLQEALKLDPDFTQALALLATVYLYQSNYEERNFDEGFELGRNTATEALAIDPALSGTWGLLAYIQAYYDWDWTAAELSIERMLASGTLDANVKRSAATYYAMTGQFEKSLEMCKQAIQLDPLNPYFRISEAFTLQTLGRFDEAARSLQTLLEMHPGNKTARLLQAKTLLLQGDAKDALDLLEAAPAESEMDKSFLALALRGAGRINEADDALDSMPSNSNGGAAHYRALYHAWAGERNLALKELEIAVDSRYRVLAYVLGEPLLFPIHDDPKWRNLLERIGLLDYWLKVPEEYGGPIE